MMDAQCAGRATVEPRQKRSRGTRNRIFRAASGVFASRGFEGARIEDIARRAGVNRQRIYAYFGCKRDLYRAVLIHAYSEVAEFRGLQDLSEADLPGMTARIIDLFFEIHERKPQFWRLLCWENLNGGRSLSEEDWQRIRGSYIHHLAELYQAGQRRGVFRHDVDFTTYLLMLFATTYFCFSNRITISKLLALELGRGEVRHRVEEQFSRVMAHGVGGGQPNAIKSL